MFCQAAGFPSDSPTRRRPRVRRHHPIGERSGDLFARLGSEPMLLPTLVADKVCGLTVAGAVTAALFHRQRTGEGQRVEVPMIDVMRAFVLVEHGAGAIPVPAVAGVGYERILTTERRPRPTLDGWISVLPYRRRDYRALFAAGGRDDLHDDPRHAGRAQRIKHSASLYRDVAEVLATQTTAFWIDFCGRAGDPRDRGRDARRPRRRAAGRPSPDRRRLPQHPAAGAVRGVAGHGAPPRAADRGARPRGADRGRVLVRRARRLRTRRRPRYALTTPARAAIVAEPASDDDVDHLAGHDDHLLRCRAVDRGRRPWRRRGRPPRPRRGRRRSGP